MVAALFVERVGCYYGLPKSGGWIVADFHGGWTALQEWVE